MGIPTTFAAVTTAIPLLPYGVQVGITAGTAYAGYNIIKPIVPYIPALAAGIDIKQVLTSFKDSALAFNQQMATRIGISPIATGAAGGILALAGTRWMYQSGLTALRWARGGIYVALAWPLLQFTYSFAKEAYNRINERRVSKAQSEALIEETQRLNEASEEAVEALKEEL